MNMNQMNNNNNMNNMMGMNNMNAPQQKSGDIFDTLFNPSLLNDQESMFNQNNSGNNQNENIPSGPKVDPFSNLVNLIK